MGGGMLGAVSRIEGDGGRESDEVEGGRMAVEKSI